MSLIFRITLHFIFFPLSLCSCWVDFPVLDCSRTWNAVSCSYFNCVSMFLCVCAFSTFLKRWSSRYLTDQWVKCNFCNVLRKCHLGFLTWCLLAGGEGVSSPESSVFSGFPGSSASIALYRCWSNWNRVLHDGACEGRFFGVGVPHKLVLLVCWHLHVNSI